MYFDTPRPRLLRFLLVDPFALLAGLILLAAWAVLLPAAWLGYLPLGIGRLIFAPAEVALLRWLTGTLTLIALPVWLVRVRIFALAAAQPIESWGEITRVDTYWWGRRFQFYYFCQGAKLHSQNFSLRTQAAMRLSTADPVLVVYNQFLSSRALLQDLYVWQSADKPQGKPK